MQYGSSHRLFIAIIPPKEVRDFVRDSKRILKKESRNLKFIPVDNLHITIQFLGASVSEESLQLITQRLEEISHNLPSPIIEFKELRFGFPGQLKPSVIFWDVEVNQELKSLSTDVHTTIKALGLRDTKKQKDHAKLIHHMTIARTKRTLSNRHIEDISKFIKTNIPTKLPSFKAKEIAIFESFLTEKGSSYKLVSSFPLKSS